MIIILSENNDQSTSEVIEWLLHSKVDFLRIHDTDEVSIKNIEINQDGYIFDLEVKGNTISSKDVTSFWFRRGWFRLPRKVAFCPDLPSKTIAQIQDHLNAENDVLKQFLYNVLTYTRHIGSPLTDKNNKLITLLKAREFGLMIPNTWITSDIVSLPNEGRKMISKGISSVAYVECDNGSIGNYTEVVSDEDIRSSSSFFPSLFQEKLEKRFELRIFFLDGAFYSACIFSQLDPQTSVDFRKYNKRKPNRVVPFKLPQEIEVQLRNLLNFFNHRTASIDMVVTKQNEFVFLEINPIGQFGMVSYPCNYKLEKMIANYLLNGSTSSSN